MSSDQTAPSGSGLPMDSMSVATRVIRDLGVPIAMLIVVSYALWTGANWIGQHVLLPTMEDNKALVDVQVKTNDAMVASLQTITKNIEAQTELNHNNSKALESMAGELRVIRENTGKTATELPEIRAAIEKDNG